MQTWKQLALGAALAVAAGSAAAGGFVVRPAMTETDEGRTEAREMQDSGLLENIGGKVVAAPADASAPGKTGSRSLRP